MAKDLSVAEGIKKCFAERRVKKTYQAIVCGFPKTAHGVWKDSLVTQKKGSHVRSILRDGSRKSAICHYQIINKIKKYRIFTQLLLRPETGKTHQLRVQCASHGFPILGDRTYGDYAVNLWAKKTLKANRLFLHAEKVEFELNYNQKVYYFTVESPLPESFKLLKS